MTANSAPTSSPQLVRWHAYQIGPGVDQPGGIASVIRSYLELSSDNLIIAPLQTYAVGARLWSVRYFLQAAFAILRLTPSPTTLAHFHLSQDGAFVREGLLLRLAARRGHTTCVTLHGSRFLTFFSAHPRRVLRVLRTADGVAVLGSGVQRALREHGISSTILKNPIAFPESLPGRLPQAGGGGPVLLFAGHCSLSKGLDVLLAAWPLVLERYPEARLLIAGPPGDFEPSAAPSVSRIGNLAHSDLLKVLQDSTLAVLPSRAEAMPMFLIEAMAYAKPVVATSVGAVKELVGDAGIVVEPGDHRALAAAIRRLLDDPAGQARLGRAGRERARDHAQSRTVCRLQQFYADAYSHHAEEPFRRRAKRLRSRSR